MPASFDKYLSLRSIFSFSAINYIQSGLGFFITIILARYLSKEEYGNYTYGMVFMNVMLVLASFGMDKSLVRDMVQDKKNQSNCMLISTMFKGMLSIVLMVGLVCWAYLSFPVGNGKLYVSVLGGFAGLLLALSARAWYDVSGRIQLHAQITLGERLLFFLGIVGILWLCHGPLLVTFTFIALIVSRILFLSLEWINIKNEFGQILKSIPEYFKLITRNNSWIWLAAIGNIFMVQFNQLILESSSGLRELAAFGLAFQLVQFIRMLQSQILRLASPRIAEVSKNTDFNEIRKELFRLCALSLASTLLLVMPFYLVVPYFITYVVGQNFTDSIDIFNVLLIWTILYGVALINNQFLISLHLQRSFFFATLFFGILSLVLANYLVGIYSAMGAALSLLIAHAGSILTQTTIVLWHLRSSRHNTQ